MQEGKTVLVKRKKTRENEGRTERAKCTVNGTKNKIMKEGAEVREGRETPCLSKE